MKQKQIFDHAAEQDAALQTVSFAPNCAKQLGRTVFHADTNILWCSLSASGIAFGFRGKACILHLVADSAYQTGSTLAARYAVYLNDKLVLDAQLTEPEQTLTIPGNDGAITLVRLIKLSEATFSSLGIGEICIQTAADDLQALLIPEPRKSHLIEFIGDSITCGYGVDGQCGEPFRTASENAEKAFAYLTAQQFDADYSMVCYSGYGILSGYTADGTVNTEHLVLPYYPLVGHSEATLETCRRIDEDAWDFSVQPDLIVLNLGTNDSSYTGTDSIKQHDFAEAYGSLLKNIREKNPRTPILCTLGIMGQTLCEAMELAVSRYAAETCDSNIRTMRFAMQSEADGYSVDWHPSAITHEKAAAALCAEIRTWLGWQNISSNL